MKKSKLLIPALSIASVGAVVAPMVTSCAKSNVIDLFDENYEAMDPVDKGETIYSQPEAAKFYFGADNAKDIIYDDIRAFLSVEANLAYIVVEYAKEIFGTDVYASLDQAHAQITIVGIDYHKNTNTATVNGKIALDAKATIYTSSAKTKKYADYELQVSYELTDVLYCLWWHAAVDPVPAYWSLGCFKDRAAAAADKDWKIVRSYKGTATYADNGDVESATALDAWRYDRLPEQGQLNYIGWESNYLSEVKGKVS